jgi:hypothetical protein
VVPLPANNPGRVGIMHKRTGKNVMSTDMVKKARRSTSAVEEKRRNKEETACAFVGKRVCKRRCSAPATSRRTMRELFQVSGTGDFYTPNFLWNLHFIFFETQNINCETRTLFRV